MKWMYPQFLFALAILAIPIIIHLFNFRKFKQVYFPSLRFLQQIQQQTKKQSKLKHLLVLLSRMLAFSFLVFAFARPFIPATGGKTNTGLAHISVYLDNSFSMDSKGPNGYLFEEAREKVIALAELFSPSDKFHLVTNDMEGRHQRWVSRDEFVQLTEEVQLTGSTRPYADIYLRQKDMMALAENNNRKAFAFSDFQKSSFDLTQITVDSSLSYTLIPLENPARYNVYIDSVWFDDPVRKISQEEVLKIRIKHNYEKSIEVKCDLEINGKPTGFGNYRLEPGENNIEVELPFTLYEKGNIAGKLQLNEYSDPDLLFDDTYYFSYQINEKINVLSLFEPGADSVQRYTNRIFRSQPGFSFTQSPIHSLDYSKLSLQHCLILNDITNIPGGLSAELVRFVHEGGNLVLFPAAKADINQWNGFLDRLNTDLLSPSDTGKIRIAKLNQEHPLYKDVFDRIPENMDLPTISQRFSLKSTRLTPKQSLLTLYNGDSYLVDYKTGKGKVYLFASPLSPEYSNLVRHSIFVTSLYRIAETSGNNYPISYQIGSPYAIEITDEQFIEGKTAVHEIKTTRSFLPAIKKEPGRVSILLADEMKEAGHLEVRTDEKVILPFAVNYNRKESETATHSQEDLKEILKENNPANQFSVADIRQAKAAESLAGIVLNKEFWWHCIFFVILFLLIETMILRLWK